MFGRTSFSIVHQRTTAFHQTIIRPPCSIHRPSLLSATAVIAQQQQQQQQQQPIMFIQRKRWYNNNNTVLQFPLSEFRDPISRQQRMTDKVGRQWKARELRRKSYDDLHKLWYILYKERNMLMTELQLSRRKQIHFPQPERFKKVRKSMGAIKHVLGERKREHLQRLKEEKEGEEEEKQNVEAAEAEAMMAEAMMAEADSSNENNTDDTADVDVVMMSEPTSGGKTPHHKT